jgi:hypothetical protein
MNKYDAKLAALSSEQSKALSKSMNAAYNKGGKKSSSKTVRKPPAKK